MAKAAARPAEEAGHDLGLAVTETRVDPARDALQKAAMKDYQRRSEPGTWVQLGNGEMVKVQAASAPSYPGEDVTDMLARPGDMIARDSRKPDYYSNEVLPNGERRKISDRYQWRIRTSTDLKDNRPQRTANEHRRGRIRYVETKEIDRSSPIALYTEFNTTHNTYVTHDNMILCEILDVKLGFQTYKGWEDYAIGRTVNIQTTVQDEKAEGPTIVEGKTVAEVKVGDTRVGG